MPSWGIHLKLAKKLNNKLKLDDELFTFGNLIPDVDSDSIYNRRDAHYYTGIMFSKCPNELEIDLEKFKEDYRNRFSNPLVIGYFCHILTDEFFNEYVYVNKWIQNDKKNVVGVKCYDGSIIDVSDFFRRSLKFKHDDFEKYGRFIYNNEDLFIPSDINKILSEIDILNDKFYSAKNVRNRINYLNNGEFKEFNKFTYEDICDSNKYILFTKDELDKLFNDCYLYILDELKKEGIIS